MSAHIGRERDLAIGVGLVSTAKSTPVARTVTIEGTPGVGKTALLAALRDASPDWLHAATAAHRIQTSLGFAVVRRLLSALIAALGPEGDRYTAGLGEIDDAKEPGQILLRLLEGLTLDHPVFLSVDDAQWIDDDSANALASIIAHLADRPIVLATTQRTESSTQAGLLQYDQWIALRPLSERAATEVARLHYPEGSPEVIAAIVGHSAGQPIDLVTLASAASERGAQTSDEVAESMREIAMRAIQALPPQNREFLQVMSLLNEPIDYALLHRIWRDGQVLVNLIAAASERFIIQEGAQLRFTHALLASAILETIPVKIPMRRKILEALDATPAMTVEDRLQIVDQARACGDWDLAKSTLTQLAYDAIQRGQVRLTIDACKQLLALSEPRDEDFVAIYSGYARALQFIDRIDRAVEVLKHALDEAARRKIGGTAPLAAQLVLGLLFHDHPDAALENYTRFYDQFQKPEDRLQLHSAALWFAVCDADGERLQRVFDDQAASNAAPPELELRSHIARAYHSVRIGDFQDANLAVTRFNELARTVPDALRNLTEFATAQVELQLLGTAEQRFASLRARHHDAEGGSGVDYAYAMCELLGGRYDNAALVLENLTTYDDPLHRRRMLAVAAALSALQRDDIPYRNLIEGELSRLLTGARGYWYLPLASWACLLSSTPDNRARVLGRMVVDHLRKPGDPFLLVQATPLAISASNRGDADLLAIIADDTTFWQNKSPIANADFALARAIARGSNIAPAIEECNRLGLVALAHIAEGLAQKASAPRADTKGPLTARERQIAGLVAGGKTNREIAEDLVLSERTIEGHIANIFNKLNLSSRTQVAAWFLSAKTAV